MSPLRGTKSHANFLTFSLSRRIRSIPFRTVERKPIAPRVKPMRGSTGSATKPKNRGSQQDEVLEGAWESDLEEVVIWKARLVRFSHSIEACLLTPA